MQVCCWLDVSLPLAAFLRFLHNPARSLKPRIRSCVQHMPVRRLGDPHSCKEFSALVREARPGRLLVPSVYTALAAASEACLRHSHIHLFFLDDDVLSL